MSVRLGIPEVDYRNSLDDGSFIITDANAKIRYYLAGTTTLTEVWADKDLTTSLGSSVSILASGWPEYVNVWGADDVSYKATIQRTGYNSGNEKDFDWINVATATSATGDSTPAFTNSIANGDFTQWSGPTSFSNISGSAAAVEIADGFYFSQNNAAANAISRQSADSDGARYGLRFGRPAASSSTEQLRVFFTLPTEEAIRYRGKTGTFSIAIKKGANFSGTALGILGVTGTGVEEDGNSINSGAWTGQASFISASQAINTDIARFQFSGAIGENISEIGFQLAYTPTGTAGANDWVQVEDIQFQDAAAAGDFEALPKRVTKLLTRGYAERGASIASAGTVDLYKATGDFIDITGTTTITSFGEAEAGFEINVRFTGILQLTYNGASLILPTGANITTAANDCATFVSLGSGNWICTKYARANGRPTDANLASIGALGYTSGDYLIKKTAAGVHSLISITANAQSLLADTDVPRLGSTNSFTQTNTMVGVQSVLTPIASNTAGYALTNAGTLQLTATSGISGNFNRKTDDGGIVGLYQDGTLEGSISVAGTTVSYNAFMGSHWAQLADWSKPDIPVGTIMQSLDDLCRWVWDVWTEVIPATDDEAERQEKRRTFYYGSDMAVGETYVDANGATHTIVEEINERLPRVKVSNEAAAKSVYGVFFAWENDDDGPDMYVAALGAGMIRIAPGETPQCGEFIESNGDGCGRVQADDILRASTVAKVTSATPVRIYDDGSFLVPCTLHCG